MPAPLDVDWPAVRVLALAVGVREAARQMGISEDAVMQRSSREGWLSDPRVRAIAQRPVTPVSANVSAPHTALAQSMKEDALRGRAAALRVSRRALERTAQLDDDELIVPEVAQMAHTWTKSASIAGGYGAADAVARVDLRVTAQRDQAIEAEFTEMPQDQGFTEI